MKSLGEIMMESLEVMGEMEEDGLIQKIGETENNPDHTNYRLTQKGYEVVTNYLHNKPKESLLMFMATVEFIAYNMMTLREKPMPSTAGGDDESVAQC